MSQEHPLRRALRQQDAIAAALATRSHEELVKIAADLMKTYVVDGASPQKPDVGRVHVPQHLRGLGFASLIETLKFHLDLKELEQFTVTDGQVFVKLGGREFALDGAAPPPARAAAPPARLVESPPVIREPPAAPAPRVEAPPRPEVKPPGPSESDDRFRMLELD